MSESTQAAVAQIEAALRNAGLLDFSGEVQLLEWCKSSSRDGPKVKLLLQDDDAVVPFESATIKKGKQAGQLYHVFAIRIDEEPGQGSAPPPQVVAPKPPGNALARALHTKGYFNNPKLWQAMHERGVYTQSLHKAWIESLPCHCASPEMQQIPDIGLCQGQVCAHHCTSAALPSAGRGAENPRKPPHWYCLPMCHQHHMVWCHSSVGAGRVQKTEMLEAAVALTASRVKAAMKRHIGIESLKTLTLEQLRTFEFEMRLPLTEAPDER